MDRYLKLIFTAYVLSIVGMTGCSEETAVIPTRTPQEATSQALTDAILASSEPPLDFEQLTQEISESEALWASQNLTTYRLEVSYREPNWNTQNFTLLIEDGVVTEEDHRCIPERTCVLQEVDLDAFEMHRLFDIAQEVVALEDENTHITFNKRLGFPNAIGYTEAVWIIQSVQVIEEE